MSLLENINKNPEEVKKKTAAKIYYLNANEIKENSNNSIYSQNGIDELADEIETVGLLNPLMVYMSEDGYILLSGHRRLKAIETVIERNGYFVFNEATLNLDSIPVTVVKKPESIEEEMDLLMQSNITRNLSKEERLVIYDVAEKTYEALKAIGKKPRGRKREYVAARAGVSDRTYENEAKERKSFDAKKEISVLEKERKKLNKLETYYMNINSKLTDEELESLKADIIPLVNLILSKANIDISEL